MATDLTINVTDSRFGAAGDGETNDTLAFQKALNAAKRIGGVVSVPPGDYKIAGTLRIPANVALEGVLRTPPMPWRNHVPGKGTTLLAFAGKGDGDGDAFITLGGPNSVVKGLSVYYPEQEPPEGSNAEFIPYPWTIQDSRGGSNNAVVDVLLVNSYQGIDFTTGSKRHTIRRVYGQPLFRGIQVDWCTDIGRIEDVHFWPFWVNWEQNERIRELIARDGVALILRRSDWQIVHNFFCFGYQTGVRFERSELEMFEGKRQEANGQFTNLNLDSVGVGLDVHALKNQGVQVANVNIALGRWRDLYPERRAIWGRPGQTGALSVRGASVWGRYDEVVKWESEGQLLLSSSIIDHWMGDSAIRIEKGRAIIQGNCFTRQIRDSKSITVEPTAGQVTIINNQLANNPIDDRGPRTVKSDNPLPL